MRVTLTLYSMIIWALLGVPWLWSDTDAATEAYLKGDYKAVVKRLQKKVDKGDAGIQEQILLARSYIHLEKNKNGRRILEAVLKADNENPEANSLLGEVYFKAGEFDRALPVLDRARKLKPDPEIFSLLGRCHYELDDFNKAAIFLKQAVEEDIRNPLNGFLLGRIYLLRGYGMRAEQYLLKARTAGKADAELFAALGQAYLLQRKYTGPIVIRHISEKPTTGSLLPDGIILGSSGQAENTYHVASQYSSIYCGFRLQALEANSVEALYMVAEGFLSYGDFARVGELLARMEKRDKDKKRRAGFKARALLLMEKLEELEKYLDAIGRKKLLSAKDLTGYYYSIGLRYRAQGRREDALKVFLKAEALNPASETVIRTLAEVYRAMGDTEKAYAYFTRIVELFPDAEDLPEIRNIQMVLDAQRMK